MRTQVHSQTLMQITHDIFDANITFCVHTRVHTHSHSTVYGQSMTSARTSHLKSGVILRSTFSRPRVMGCTCAASCSLGNWCTRRCSVLPYLGMRMSSPSSCTCTHTCV